MKRPERNVAVRRRRKQEFYSEYILGLREASREIEPGLLQQPLSCTRVRDVAPNLSLSVSLSYHFPLSLAIP